MVRFAQGYYVRDSGVGENVYFHMGGEPPLGQSVLHDGKWEPLSDGFYLGYKLITGEVDYDGPIDLPEGVPPIDPRQMSPA